MLFIRAQLLASLDLELVVLVLLLGVRVRLGGDGRGGREGVEVRRGVVVVVVGAPEVKCGWAGLGRCGAVYRGRGRGGEGVVGSGVGVSCVS